jgi:hypothetical protein
LAWEAHHLELQWPAPLSRPAGTASPREEAMKKNGRGLHGEVWVNGLTAGPGGSSAQARLHWR